MPLATAHLNLQAAMAEAAVELVEEATVGVAGSMEEAE